MEIILVIGVILLAYICFLFWGKMEENKRKQYLLNRLKSEYGSILKYEYSQERLSALKGFFLHNRGEEDYIDDITWNDIDGERLFKRINYCYSSTGEEYLYYRLRTPRFQVSKEEVLAYEKRLSLLDIKENERVKLQYEFAKMGRTGKYSIFQYINWLDTVKEKNSFVYISIFLIYILCIGMIFVWQPIGILALVGFVLFMILRYLKLKHEIEPYLISFSYLLNTLSFVDRMSKNPYFKEIWEEDLQRLLVLRKSLKGISAFRMFFLVKGNGDMLIEAIKQYSNALTHFDLWNFNSMLKSIKTHKQEIGEILEIIGRMEAEISIASFRRSLPYFCVPDFESEKGMRIVDGIHPLLENPVANSFSIQKGMLLTGSNASGKSTFLRMVEICALLAQTIGSVPAKEYHAPEYRIFSSMAVQDNLENNESYYIVEIKAIKRILEKCHNSSIPVLCFVDEILRGTNTIERISAASEILKAFTREGILTFAATHDVELTKILEDVYDNYHFEEDVTDEDIRFSYCLLNGPARTRNAIKLLCLMGYPVEITDNAEIRAKRMLSEKVGKI